MYIERFENVCDLYINLIIEFIFFLIKNINKFIDSEYFYNDYYYSIFEVNF